MPATVSWEAETRRVIPGGAGGARCARRAHRDNYPSALRNAGFTLRLFPQPLREEMSGRFEAPLLMLLAAVGLVLLVACATVAKPVERVTARRRELPCGPRSV